MLQVNGQVLLVMVLQVGQPPIESKHVSSLLITLFWLDLQPSVIAPTNEILTTGGNHICGIKQTVMIVGEILIRRIIHHLEHLRILGCPMWINTSGSIVLGYCSRVRSKWDV